MAEHNSPADLRAEVEKLKRQVRQLQANNRLSSSAIRGGDLIFEAADGTKRFALGNVEFSPGFGSRAGYGVFKYDKFEAMLSGIDENRHGIMFPPIEMATHTTEARGTTSATFEGLWEGGIADLCHDTIFASMAVQSSAGTTGEIKMHGINSGVDTDAVTIPAGFNGFVTFQWLHPYTVGAFDKRPDRVGESDVIQVQARRTAGTGSIFVFGLRHFLATSTWLQPAAAANGNGQLL